MIYLIMVVVFGFAGYQLYTFLRKLKAGKCSSGCGSCGMNGACSKQPFRLDSDQKQI